MYKILVMRLYFILDAVHVSDCISPTSGAILYLTGCTAHKIAPDVGLIQSETCTASNIK